MWHYYFLIRHARSFVYTVRLKQKWLSCKCGRAATWFVLKGTWHLDAIGTELSLTYSISENPWCHWSFLLESIFTEQYSSSWAYFFKALLSCIPCFPYEPAGRQRLSGGIRSRCGAGGADSALNLLFFPRVVVLRRNIILDKGFYAMLHLFAISM